MSNNPTASGSTVTPPRETVRQGGGGATYTSRVYPMVYGGVCERCGILNKDAESTYQYKLCEHYRGMELICNYCDNTKDPTEVARISKLKIYDHPFKRDSFGRPALGVVCDSFTCTNAFRIEFGDN